MKVCRTCANSDVNKSPMLKLFDMRIKHLLQYIQIFTGLLLTRKNGMPEYICDTCLQDLERAIKFRKRCIETQKKLSRNYNVNSVRRNKKTGCETGDSVISFSPESMPECQDEIINDTIEYDISLTEITLQEEPFDLESKNELSRHYDYNSVRTEKKTEDETDDSVISFIIEKMPECQDDSINITKDYDKSPTETTVQEDSSEVVHGKFKKRIKKMYGPFVCEFCGKSFNFIGNFRDHQLRHTGIKKFNCHLCSFKFCTNRELATHIRRHKGERPYACKYCESRFVDSSNKARHEKRHLDERHFKCEKCDKSFMTSGCLKKHMLTHTGIRTHSCSVCNQWFLRRTHLSTHLRSKGHIQNLANHEISNNEKQEEII